MALSCYLLLSLFHRTGFVSLPGLTFPVQAGEATSWRRYEVSTKVFAFLSNMSSPRLVFEAVPELMSFRWQGFSLVVALPDCRYFHDVWAHMIPIFYQDLKFWLQSERRGNPCYHLFVKSTYLCYLIFSCIWYILYWPNGYHFSWRGCMQLELRPLIQRLCRIREIQAPLCKSQGKVDMQ